MNVDAAMYGIRHLTNSHHFISRKDPPIRTESIRSLSQRSDLVTSSGMVMLRDFVLYFHERARFQNATHMTNFLNNSDLVLLFMDYDMVINVRTSPYSFIVYTFICMAVIQRPSRTFLPERVLQSSWAFGSTPCKLCIYAAHTV